MKMKLTRLDSTDRGVFGRLECDGFECVTLERHDIDIPTGTYKVTLYDSPEHKCLVPLLSNVPNRSFIEIHWGNWEKDSKGCILVGTNRDGFAIDNSRKAFDGLMSKLMHTDDISIQVV